MAFDTATDGAARFGAARFARVPAPFRASPPFRASRSAERGSAPAEFAMAGALLALLTLAVLQFALVLHVRNTLQDSAAEGARVASLTGGTPHDGIRRTRELITTALGPGYAEHVRYREDRYLGQPASTVVVSAPLPVIGLLGVGDRLEVSGHAGRELGIDAPR